MICMLKFSIDICITMCYNVNNTNIEIFHNQIV